MRGARPRPVGATMSGDDGERRVRLEVPAASRFLRLVRLAASGLASEQDFDIDAIEDLRVAVDEACAALLLRAPEGARLVLDLDVEDDTIVVRGRCAVEGTPSLHPVAADVLGLLADDFELHAEDGEGRFRLRKRPLAAEV